MNWRVISSPLLCVLLAMAGTAVRAAEGVEQAAQPTDRVAEFHLALTELLSAPADFSVRTEQLHGVLVDTFDLGTIARICLGKTWRTLSAADRSDFTDLLTKVVVATYVSRFDQDRGQRFATLDATEARPGQWLVRAEIQRSSGSSVPLDYYFRNGRVFNVVADGVSDLAVRRADYATVLGAEGFTGLVASLQSNLERMRADFVANHAGG